MNGWLNIYKPKNTNSAHIVAIVKRAFKGLKTGHAGTLDPLAEGVLPIALGEATKLADMLVSAEKTYEFTVKFGARTESGDLGSEVIETTDALVAKGEIEKIIPKFIGEITQTPSKFSAIKIKGVRAYKLARSGAEVAMPSRKIHIYSLKLLSFNEIEQTATLIAECSKGTYIRSLGEDIAFSLQNLGHVIELKRLAVGKFVAQNAIDLTKLDLQLDMQQIYDQILPVDFVLDDILVINVVEDIALRIRNGQKVNIQNSQDGLSAVYCNGILCAIGEIESGLFKIKRVFNL